ncbi:hypothetical protein Bca4012_047698 [Brassica carinata]
MEDPRDNEAYEEELLDYEEEEEKAPDSATKVNGDAVKKGYVGIHSSGFRDFLLKPELLRAIVDSGFEHPSEGKCFSLMPFVSELSSSLGSLAAIFFASSSVQHECIPQAILGMDVICQAKSGMGKTAVFVLSTLQQIEPTPGQVSALILCHTRELAYQICNEFVRFSTYLPDTKVSVFYGGVNNKIHKDLLKNECPHIVVGTPGRVLGLARDKDLSLKNVRHFILDECDKMLESLDMRRDVQEIFKMTPHDKQVMMFSATLSKEIRPVCKKFMQDRGSVMSLRRDVYKSCSLDILIPEHSASIEKALAMEWDLLSSFSFSIYCHGNSTGWVLSRSVVRSQCSSCSVLLTLMDANLVDEDLSLRPMEIYVDDEAKLTLHGLVQHYIKLSEMEKNRKLNDLLDALDFNQVVIFVKSVSRAGELNKLLIECNFPSICIHSGMSQEERAGRFGTKGLAITFVASASDSEVLNQVQDRFEVDIKELPEQIDTSTYMPS